jgi:hypothetical protein
MNVHMPLARYHTSHVTRHPSFATNQRSPASSRARDVGRGVGGGGASMRRWPHDLDKGKELNDSYAHDDHDVAAVLVEVVVLWFPLRLLLLLPLTINDRLPQPKLPSE